MIIIAYMFLAFGIFKVHIGYSKGILMRARLINTILVLPYGEAFEFHHVLSKCACLVTENVVYHAQFLIKI